MSKKYLKQTTLGGKIFVYSDIGQTTYSLNPEDISGTKCAHELLVSTDESGRFVLAEETLIAPAIASLVE